MDAKKAILIGVGLVMLIGATLGFHYYKEKAARKSSYLPPVVLVPETPNPPQLNKDAE